MCLAFISFFAFFCGVEEGCCGRVNFAPHFDRRVPHLRKQTADSPSCLAQNSLRTLRFFNVDRLSSTVYRLPSAYPSAFGTSPTLGEEFSFAGNVFVTRAFRLLPL